MFVDYPSKINTKSPRGQRVNHVWFRCQYLDFIWVVHHTCIDFKFGMVTMPSYFVTRKFLANKAKHFWNTCIWIKHDIKKVDESFITHENHWQITSLMIKKIIIYSVIMPSNQTLQNSLINLAPWIPWYGGKRALLNCTGRLVCPSVQECWLFT